ncbi:MAG TPA: redox-sensing transcriptional repressor Rex [Candidatus Fimenecus sp.]|nr:redox-sensing transcriptional repressor Rex [Candidatus Fimenecus sp.]
MAKNDSVSLSVVKRLPRYYRFLGEIKKNGTVRISSGELSKRMGFTASQIRQDLNCFGGFGQQGYGYNVEQLYKEIGSILGVNNHLKTILIGAGNLGHAIASHMSFDAGKLVRNIPVRHINGLYDFCRDNSPAVAVLCIPSDNAKEIVDELVKLGVKGFWNFSHYDIASDYPNVAVENVHLSDSLMTLSYHVSNL